MIDRSSRDVAASLIRRFRDEALTNDQFEDDWPDCWEDRALRALSTMLWQFYSDDEEHALTGEHALTLEGHEFFTRCALFADSDLPYEWAEDNFIRISPGRPTTLALNVFLLSVAMLSLASLLGLLKGSAVGGLCVVLSIGWVIFRDQRIRRSDAQFYAALKASGDTEVWPFIRRSDYDATRLADSKHDVRGWWRRRRTRTAADYLTKPDASISRNTSRATTKP